MSVPVRDLRNNSAALLRRVEQGESVIVTKDGAPVAQVTPLPRRPLTKSELVARRATLPRVDADAWRRDIDELMDPSL